MNGKAAVISLYQPELARVPHFSFTLISQLFDQMNELDKKFEKKRSQILSTVFSPDGAAFVGSFRESLGRDWVGVVSKCTMGLFWGCHPFSRKMGQKEVP